MAEEAPASETSVTMPQPVEAVTVDGTLNPVEHEESGISVEANLDSVSNNGNAAEASALASGSDCEKSLEFAEELMDKGNKAMKENDFGEAADNFSRALEIRFVFHLVISWLNRTCCTLFGF